MITNIGKNILAKYLIGQAPAYASFVAVGGGAKPLIQSSVGVLETSILNEVALIETDQAHGFSQGDSIQITNVGTSNIDSVYTSGIYQISAVPTETSFTFNLLDEDDLALENISPAGLAQIDFSNKKALDFEMFRVPIVSRGFVNENDISKIVFTAELPSEERYDITEVGIYSAAENALARSIDSKLLYSFSQDEPWEYHTQDTSLAISTFYDALDGGNNTNIITVQENVFQSNADNEIFANQDRVNRYEQSRFLNNMVLIIGDDSHLILDEEDYLTTNPVVDPVTDIFSNHIHLTGVSLNLDQNSATDEMRLAFSIINKNGADTDSPDKVRILIEFASSDTLGVGDWARFEVNIENGLLSGQQDFSTNRYFVVKKQLQELRRSEGFTWSSVDTVKVYACLLENDLPSNDYYVSLDAIRLENLTTANSLYGLTGYSKIVNDGAKAILKAPNSTNYLEFRFAVDVN